MVEGKRSPIRCRGRAPKVAISVALLVMALACGDRNTYAPPPPPKVTVSQPLKKPVTDYLEFTGNAAAFNTVPLRARVEGFLEKVLFQDGDTVKKGQPLFLIQQEHLSSPTPEGGSLGSGRKSPTGACRNRICSVLPAG